TSLSAGSVTIAAAGSVNFGSVTFASSGSVSITEDSATQLAGAHTAGTLVLTSAGAVTEAAGASLTVTNNAALTGAAITLGSGPIDNFGSLTFNASGTV